jgi:hypothetical protein
VVFAGASSSGLVIIGWTLTFFARFSWFAFVGISFLFGEWVKIEVLCAVGVFSFAEEFGDFEAFVLVEEVGVFGLEVEV